MTEYNDDYQARLLYKQIFGTDEGPTVTSASYAVKWTYPGATTPTTSRLRLTCIYKDKPAAIEVITGTIERWSDKSWLLIDEYCDDRMLIATEEEFLKRLMSMAHAFIMGVPISIIDDSYVADTALRPLKSKKTNFRVLNFEKHNKKDLNKNKKDTSSKKDNDDDDDDDFEFI